MKIAVVSTSAVAVPPQGYGGTELMLSGLVEGLVAAGHAVTLFATGDSRTRATLRALYERAVWPIDPLCEVNHVAWSLSEIARSGDYDVVHVNNADALAIARFVDAPFVHTMHHTRTQTLSRFYLHFPDVHYVAISARQREREVRLPHMYVVPHGLDPGSYPFVPVPEDYVAFLGRFNADKAPHLAIDAARHAGVPIRLAGRPHEGEGEAYNEQEMRWRLALPGVSWLGEAASTAKVALLGRARATLFPICWEEPFGLVMAESMLCGTPVIAFPRGSAPEVVEPGVTGLLVEDMERMAEAIPRAAALDRARCRARAIARFSSERMVGEYLAVYAEAIRHRASRGRQGAAIAVGAHPSARGASAQ